MINPDTRDHLAEKLPGLANLLCQRVTDNLLAVAELHKAIASGTGNAINGTNNIK